MVPFPDLVPGFAEYGDRVLTRNSALSSLPKSDLVLCSSSGPNIPVGSPLKKVLDPFLLANPE
jgi:hypothetical protein